MGLLSWLFGNRGGDGSSASEAVVVNSIQEEYAWMLRHCPGFTPQMQSLQEIDGQPYDVHTLRNARGEVRTVYFDISRFYGKY
jgi:hypothetical protein